MRLNTNVKTWPVNTNGHWGSLNVHRCKVWSACPAFLVQLLIKKLWLANKKVRPRPQVNWIAIQKDWWWRNLFFLLLFSCSYYSLVVRPLSLLSNTTQPGPCACITWPLLTFSLLYLLPFPPLNPKKWKVSEKKSKKMKESISFLRLLDCSCQMDQFTKCPQKKRKE